jgi:hypothetical protein
MKKLLLLAISLTMLAGCTEGTGVVDAEEEKLCPAVYTKAECDDYYYWQEYYEEHPERAKKDLEEYMEHVK